MKSMGRHLRLLINFQTPPLIKPLAFLCHCLGAAPTAAGAGGCCSALWMQALFLPVNSQPLTSKEKGQKDFILVMAKERWETWYIWSAANAADNFLEFDLQSS